MKLRTAILVLVCLVSAWYNAICFSDAGSIGLKHGLSSDFYILWSASKAIMQGVNPYGPEVTEQNQIVYFGATAKALGSKTEWRFPYPIYATFPLFPLAFLDFRTANEIVFWLFAALTALSVGWLRGKWDRTTVLYCALAFSTYPVIYALQGRQPTVLFFGLAIGAYALLRSGRLVWAGALAALSAGKPHVALAVLLPMLIWTLSRWHERKRFAISSAAFLLGLFITATIASPGWIPEWFATIPHYAQYVRGPLLTLFFGDKIGLAISVLVFLSLIAILWLHRESDLLFQMSGSVTILSLIIPYEPYNLIVLLIPAVWIEDNARRIAETGAVNQIALAAVRIALILSWVINIVGALLWHASPMGRSIAWTLSGAMILPLLGCVVAMMLVQLFFPILGTLA
jgi:hypothetical protein